MPEYSITDAIERIEKRQDDHEARDNVRFDRLDEKAEKNANAIIAISTRIGVWATVLTLLIPFLTECVRSLMHGK